MPDAPRGDSAALAMGPLCELGAAPCCVCRCRASTCCWTAASGRLPWERGSCDGACSRCAKRACKAGVQKQGGCGGGRVPACGFVGHAPTTRQAIRQARPAGAGRARQQSARLRHGRSQHLTQPGSTTPPSTMNEMGLISASFALATHARARKTGRCNREAAPPSPLLCQAKRSVP